MLRRRAGELSEQQEGQPRSLLFMTTSFLRVPTQSSSQFLADDVDIIEPCAPSLLQHLTSKYHDLRGKLSWLAPPSPSQLLPSSCLLSWHHFKAAVVVADGNKLHIYVFHASPNVRQKTRCCEDENGVWLNPIVTPAKPVKSVTWSSSSHTLVIGGNDGWYDNAKL